MLKAFSEAGKTRNLMLDLSRQVVGSTYSIRLDVQFLQQTNDVHSSLRAHVEEKIYIYSLFLQHNISRIFPAYALKALVGRSSKCRYVRAFSGSR